MKKTIHYRRVIWFSNEPRTLGETLLDCFAGLDESEGVPPFEVVKGEECSVAYRDATAQPIFLQLVKYEPGASAAVIEAIETAPIMETDEANAPDGAEFIQSQLFCLVDGNDMVWTSHNAPLRESSINRLLAKLVFAQTKDYDAIKFELKPQLDSETFKKAFDEGIEGIDLRLGAFRSSLEYAMDGDSGKWPMGFPFLIKDRPSAEQVEAAAYIFENVSLQPGRRWKNPHVKALLSNIASEVYDEHDDQFTIKTKNGLRLTREKMSIHKKREIKGTKQLLVAKNVEQGLHSVLDSLKESGILEG